MLTHLGICLAMPMNDFRQSYDRIHSQTHCVIRTSVIEKTKPMEAMPLRVHGRKFIFLKASFWVMSGRKWNDHFNSKKMPILKPIWNSRSRDPQLLGHGLIPVRDCQEPGPHSREWAVDETETIPHPRHGKIAIHETCPQCQNKMENIDLNDSQLLIY